MAVNLSPIGGVAGQFFTNNGTPLSGGKIYTYAAGSSTPATTYTTAAGNVAHTNPIVLDSGGRVPTGEIWLTDGVSYKFVIKTSADVLIGTYDNIIGINSNFVNYTNSQEIQTATAGQTLFTLTGMAYAPGTNSLSVFVDGVNQYGPGAQYAYVETSSTEVTFTNGLHVGAEVKFTTSQLNSSSGVDASQVGYTPAGTGAIPTNVQNKLRQYVSVIDFGAVGDGVVDDTAAIQAALDSCLAGGTVYFPNGSYFCASGLTVSNDYATLTFAGGASLTYTTATNTLLTIDGENCKLIAATFYAPAVFDGTNEPVSYAVVRINAAGFEAESCTINNVPKVGFWFNECDNGIITKSKINGGTPDGFFTGSNTVHFGIVVDPPATGSQGNFVFSNNIINRCVQGAGSGNLGASSYEQAFAITGNVFELCWNHGWYASGIANGHTVTGNAFNACQIPVALTGKNHVVSSNTLIVQTTGSGSQLDNEWQGISIRDPYGCVVANNVIKGEAPPSSAIISLEDHPEVISTYDSAQNNIVIGNVIEITNSTVGSVSAIRILATTSTATNNTISNNVIRAPARAGDGLIEIIGSTGSVGNSIENNTVVFTGAGGNAAAIYLAGVTDTSVTNNRIRIEYDAASAVSLSGIVFNACERIAVAGNQLTCTASYGTNIAFRGFEEQTSGVENSLTNNTFYASPTKLSSSTLFVVLTTSGILVTHVGSGTPEGSVISCVGGMWRRTNGGANTTLYIKESGTSNTGWVGK